MLLKPQYKIITRGKVVRPDWNEIWKRFALDIAKRSPDPKFQVGAVIVTDDNTQVLALGYNGDHKGGPNCRESLETGKSGFIHAEVNALIKCDFNNPKNKKMYLTHSPCPVCAKCIVNAGIEEVLYIKDYKPDMTGIDILKNSNIKVKKLNIR
jgi:dCMP deaminase